MKCYFIIQARMGSTRLPQKILLPFYDGKSILELLIEKLSQIENMGIVIATSNGSENDVLESFAKQHDVICYRGSENDVLQRFIDAADAVGTEHIVRICSDNPFLELDSIRQLLAHFDEFKNIIDYISFDINGLPSIKTHYGFWTEYVTLKALKKIAALTNESLYHEHVTNYIYTHPECFKIKWIPGPSCLLDNKKIRLTIDTWEDFENAQSIYSKLCINNPYPQIQDIVTYLEKNPECYHSMIQQIKNNSK